MGPWTNRSLTVECETDDEGERERENEAEDEEGESSVHDRRRGVGRKMKEIEQPLLIRRQNETFSISPAAVKVQGLQKVGKKLEMTMGHPTISWKEL